MGKIGAQGQPSGSLFSRFMDRPILSTLSFIAWQAVVLWLFFGRPTSPLAIALVVALPAVLFSTIAFGSRRRYGERPYAERRQEGWESNQRWAREHPRLGRLVLWFIGAMVIGEMAYSIAFVVQAEWLAAVFYGAAAVGFTWMGWSWMHTLRGTPSPPRLRVPSRV